jgi:hypothetical protein
MSLVKEFWGFMKARKKFWLAPVIVVLVVLSTFIYIAGAAPVLAPLLYPIW